MVYTATSRLQAAEKLIYVKYRPVLDVRISDDWTGLDSTRLISFRIGGPLARSYKHDNEHFGSIETGNSFII
jgi:hypothetical protein